MNVTRMKLTCPTCDRSYALADGAIGDAGRDVRCSRCGTVWHATAPEPAKLAAVGAGPDEGFDTVDTDLRGDTESFFLDEGDRRSFPDPDADMSGDGMSPGGGVAAAGFDGDADAASGTTIDAEGEAVPHAVDVDHPDIESAAKPHKIKIRLRKQNDDDKRAAMLEQISNIGGPIMLACAVLLVITGIILRKPIVEGVPDLAGFYEMVGLEVNLRGLEIEGVTTKRDFEAGVPVLIVEGDIRNITAEKRPVPMIRLALLGAREDEVYAWSVTPSTTSLPPGDVVHFRSRLASPPELGVRLQVRFMDREIERPVAGGAVGLDGIPETPSRSTEASQ
ncbi:MAG: hypothetical protein C0606_10345 [Hyphomicrobiales bacterium]|nr:MAG: hypothetical protein C0606_10345 [Hyphomicrobiales bacterium]